MALAKTDVTIIRNMTEHSAVGRIFNKLYVKIVTPEALGADALDIPASAFGLQQITEGGSLSVDDSSEVVFFEPVPSDIDSTYGTSIITFVPDGTSLPNTDIDGTYYGVITGV